MFTLTVRDHFMIAHSFDGEIFGPARATHGATYIVDVGFMRDSLDEHDLIVDIGQAGALVKTELAALNLRNLDDLEEFAQRNTTTEFLAYTIFERLRAAIRSGALGDAGHALAALRVTLSESHIAWASYEADL